MIDNKMRENVNIFQIKHDDKREYMIKELKEELMNHKLFIWGCGSYSKIVIEYLKSIGIESTPTYIIDDAYYNDSKKNVTSFSRFLVENASDAVVVFGFYNYELVKEKKEKYINIIYKMYDFHFGVVNDKRIEWNIQLAKEREREYKKTYDLLSDDVSKKIMQAYLDAAIVGDFEELYQYRSVPSYFNDITNEIFIDTLVDCGAYDGDSIHDYILNHTEYKRILAFEPDPDNVKKIRDREIKEGIHDLSVVTAGVYSYDGKLFFNAKGESNSHLSSEGDVEVTVTTIDNYIDIISEHSLIKMDIEGSELEALKGAQESIKRSHPVLTICVYHKEEDLIEIPQYIYSLVGDDIYNFHLGFHGTDLAELVLYAIPKRFL